MSRLRKPEMKSFWLWIYNNVFLKYLEFKYSTTLMHLARLTLLVLAKEIVIPFSFWICVVINALWPSTVFSNILESIKFICIPSTIECLIALMAVIVFLVVAGFQYRHEKECVNLLTQVYIPYTDKMLSFLDIEHYYVWTESFAVSGNTMIDEHQLDDLHNLSLYLQSRVRHRDFERLDDLYCSLANITNDICRIINCYGNFRRPDNVVTIEKFYKREGKFNPNYNKDLKLYNDIVFLISDLTFEQTRLCNLILKNIRKLKPDYQADLGIMYSDAVISHNIYTDNEEVNVGYDDLDTFMKERENRSYHLGTGRIRLFN